MSPSHMLATFMGQVGARTCCGSRQYCERGTSGCLQVTKAMGRIVENVTDRLPKDSALAAGLARVWSKGEKPFFQLITENEDTPKQVRNALWAFVLDRRRRVASFSSIILLLSLWHLISRLSKPPSVGL